LILISLISSLFQKSNRAFIIWHWCKVWGGIKIFQCCGLVFMA